MVPVDEGEEDVLDLALAEAADSGRRLLVVFGANWCPDATAFEEALAHPVPRRVVEENFVVRRFDVGHRDRHLELMARWGLDPWRGIPAVAVLEAGGRLVSATRQGELSQARELDPARIASFLLRLARLPVS